MKIDSLCNSLENTVIRMYSFHGIFLFKFVIFINRQLNKYLCSDIVNLDLFMYSSQVVRYSFFELYLTTKHKYI